MKYNVFSFRNYTAYSMLTGLFGAEVQYFLWCSLWYSCRAAGCLGRRAGRQGGLGMLLLLGLGWVWAGADFDKLTHLARQRYGQPAVQTVQDWERLVQDNANQSEHEKLRRVNEFFNRRIRYAEDSDLWGQADYWATPLETLGRAAGDCEDYVIAKFATLRLLQVAPEKLRLTYVRARIGGAYSTVQQAHMVLSYYASAEAEPLILDSLITEIRPASRRSDLAPIFGFNAEGLWVNGSASPVANASARLSRWRDVLNRMQQEGLEVQ